MKEGAKGKMRIIKKKKRERGPTEAMLTMYQNKEGRWQKPQSQCEVRMSTTEPAPELCRIWEQRWWFC